MEKYTITGLRDPHLQNKINAISTFYLPPKIVLKHDQQYATVMGILKPGQNIMSQTYPPSRWLEPDIPAGKAYGEYENAAIAKIESHVTPACYRPLSASSAMKSVMTKLVLFTNSVPGLTPLERVALQQAHEGTIISSMKGKSVRLFPATTS